MQRWRSTTPAMTMLLLVACLRLEGPPPALDNGEPCTSGAMCEAGSVCEFDSAVNDTVCRVQGGCTTHDQCGAEGACAFGLCGSAECTESASCGLYACNVAVRQCQRECSGDSECASTAVCRDGECLSATCTDGTAARVCNGAACYDGICVGAINCEDYGCATGYVCESVQCVRPCTSDAQCERYTCFTEIGECREDCYGASDCQPGFACKDRFCQLP